MIRKFSTLTYSLVLAAGLFALSGSALYVYSTQSTLPSHVTVGGWQVGGMTYTAFKSELNQLISKLSAAPVLLLSSQPGIPNKQLSLGELGVHYSAESIAQALSPLVDGSPLTRLKARFALRSTQFPLEAVVSEEQLNAKVQAAWKELYAQRPVSAKRILKAQDQIDYAPEISVLRVNTKELAEELQAIASRLNGSPPAAPIQLSLPLYELRPPVTVDSLKQQGIDGKIAEFTTSFPPSGEGRIHNIRATAATIQDDLLAPGETFDYSKIIAETEAKFGYKEAPVILNGTLVPGVGGGICQVSTTLYNAVLRSGLQIVERRNHSLPVSYVPLGQDATFASGYINFKFRNNTGSYLWIRTETTDRAVTVKLFGHLTPGITYDIDSKIVETIQPPVNYVNNPSLHPGAERPISPGKAGYKVETYRIKRENGTAVSRELISKDTYSPVPAVVAANRGDAKPDPRTPAAPKQPIIEDGVMSYVTPEDLGL
ncbi:VanW family protein [Paenibacillus oryzisoli]|uniref:VanW family protein n=1 Tax=Paenibacillus oryzisoli TaxID=1850517 RepID=UPI003D2BA25F